MNATIAKELISPIPKENFITDNFTDYVGKCCVMGHLTRLTSYNPEDYDFSNCNDYGTEVYGMREMSRKFFRAEREIPYQSIVDVNNEICDDYPQDNPKDRVMTLLDDMIGAGY